MIQPKNVPEAVDWTLMDAYWAMGIKTPSVAQDIIKTIERDGNISDNALSDYMDQLTETFTSSFYERLKKYTKNLKKEPI